MSTTESKDELRARVDRPANASLAELAAPGAPGWNGLKTKARRGTAVVADNPRFAAYWARVDGIVGQRIAVVEVDLNGVNYGGGTVYLDDRGGEGSYKVFERGGSPRVGHREVAVVSGSFEVAE